jgi:hypothetical protein
VLASSKESVKSVQTSDGKGKFLHSLFHSLAIPKTPEKQRRGSGNSSDADNEASKSSSMTAATESHPTPPLTKGKTPWLSSFLRRKSKELDSPHASEIKFNGPVIMKGERTEAPARKSSSAEREVEIPVSGPAAGIVTLTPAPTPSRIPAPITFPAFQPTVEPPNRSASFLPSIESTGLLPPGSIVPATTKQDPPALDIPREPTFPEILERIDVVSRRSSASGPATRQVTADWGTVVSSSALQVDSDSEEPAHDAEVEVEDEAASPIRAVAESSTARERPVLANHPGQRNSFVGEVGWIN